MPSRRNFTSEPWLPLCVAWFAFTAGCATLRQGPVPRNVIEARQFSLHGIDAAHSGDWAGAEDLFRRAIEACPADEVARQRYAEALWRREMREAAIEHMEVAVELSGGHPILRARLGNMYLSRGAVEAASHEAEQAVQLRPDDPETWALLGHVRRHQGQLDEAKRCYHRALDLQPVFADVAISLAELYLLDRRPRRALATIDSLAATDSAADAPLSVPLLRAAAFKQLGQYTAAIEVLAAATNHADPAPALLCELAEARWLAGDHANARVAAQLAADRAPHDPRVQALQMRLAATVVTAVNVDRR